MFRGTLNRVAGGKLKSQNKFSALGNSNRISGVFRNLGYSKTRFASTLAFLETDGEGQLSAASLSAITAAGALNQPITTILVNGKDKGSVTSQISKIPNVEKIILSNSEEYKLPENLVPLFKKVLSESEDFTHFLVPSSFMGKSVLPRLASQLNVQPISEIHAINSATQFKRFVYAGNLIETIESSDKLILGSIRASSFEPINLEAAESASPVVEEVDYVNPETSLNVKFIKENLAATDNRPELLSAKIVVSGGKAFGSKENFATLLNPLADSLGAAIGASRAAVDAGYVDNSLQVGQTGKIIAPELYIAIGISGAIQHLAGMKDSKVIVAINKDSEAPIFNIADFGLVGDLESVIPELTKAINESK